VFANGIGEKRHPSDWRVRGKVSARLECALRINDTNCYNKAHRRRGNLRAGGEAVLETICKS